jgi:hypothetical protein
MAIADFLNSSKYFFERAGVTDVQTIMDDFATQVLANVPAWTNPTGARYASPVDGAGRFFDVEFTRTTQYKLTIVVRDQSGTTIMTRRIQIPSANGSIVRIFTGQFHCFIDIQTQSTDPEYFWAGILDLSPEVQNVHSKYVFAYSTRTTADVYGAGYFQYAFMIDDAAPASIQRICHYACEVTGRPRPQRDLLGFWIFHNLMFYVQPVGGGDHRYAGRAYQCLLVPEDAGDPGTELTIPIDAGVTGQFMIVSGLVDPTPRATVNDYRGYRMAIRVPD